MGQQAVSQTERVYSVLREGPTTLPDLVRRTGLLSRQVVQVLHTVPAIRMAGRVVVRGRSWPLYELVTAPREVACEVRVPPPPPAPPGASEVACGRVGATLALMDCVERYTEATGCGRRASPCYGCKTGAAHRSRFARS